MTKPLTPKQAAFVQEYLIDLNATQAATRAGYSTKTAYSIGDELLRKPEIRQAIEAATAERQGRTQVDQDMVIEELAAVAFADVDEPVKMGEKLKALELLGKHVGMFTDRIEHSGPKGGPIQVDNTATLNKLRSTPEGCELLEKMQRLLMDNDAV